MHTFFINTSGRGFDDYRDILEIPYETRQLVYLDCPLSEWKKKAGDRERYAACAHDMGEMIDNYKAINNDYNLIIYVDLMNFGQYAAIDAMLKTTDRAICLSAMHRLLSHYIGRTLVRELRENGRPPLNTILILEENDLPADEVKGSDESELRAEMLEFLGLPSGEEMDDAFFAGLAAGDGEDGLKAFIGALGELAAKRELVPGLLGTFETELRLLAGEVAGPASAAKAVENFAAAVGECGGDGDVDVVSFVTDRRAGKSNKQANTKRDLRLCFYLLECMQEQELPSAQESREERDVFQRRGEESAPQRRGIPRSFANIDWTVVEAALAKKRGVFISTLRRINDEQRSFGENTGDAEPQLVPKMYELEYKRFAMDEFGKPSESFVVVNVSEDDADAEQTGADGSERGEPDGTIRSETKKAVVLQTDKVSDLITAFDDFDYTAYNYAPEFGKKTSPEEFKSAALNFRAHHLKYLDRLRLHTGRTLSHYAGRSIDNKPAMLEKRVVSVTDEEFAGREREFNYALNKETETREPEILRDLADEAYRTAQTEYLKFSANRSVALTDIEKQCDWFITRVEQITESLRRIKLVALGLLAAIIVLYLPFAVVQWGAITENVLTIITALASVAIPIALLYVVFAAVSAWQRRKYYEAWDEFKAKSDEVLEENADAARKYDRLLKAYIPMLRYIYEYKLDVEFYLDCCAMASAKLAHHREKLDARIDFLKKVIEDLELRTWRDHDDESYYETAAGRYTGSVTESPEYNFAFCSGKNCEFYAVFEPEMLMRIKKPEGVSVG